MPCHHRFQEDLYPNYKLKHLFVGTFNPEWNSQNGNNANWFYGRRTNSFWRILPTVFGHENMNTVFNRLNPQKWKDYVSENNIGITDMISSILDANEDVQGPQILGFLDNELEAFHEIIFTDIIQIIQNNADTLKGVYLTRYAHTLNPNTILFQRWTEIIQLCDNLGIHHSPLVTPSNGFRLPVIQKVEIWNQNIQI